MSTIQLTESVGARVAKDYAEPKAFSTGIDFSSTDDRSLSEAIVRAGATTPSRRVFLKRPPSSQEFNRWKLDSMIDYIITTHHQYAKENAVIIYVLAQKVAHRHGKNHPELTQLTTTMFLLLHDLLNSMVKEEQILFPNIRLLIKNKGHSRKSEHTTFSLVEEWVSLIAKGHQASVKNIELFHGLTNGYTLPEDACHSYKCLFEKMKEFQDDLLMHVHLENNILFPKALIEYKESQKMIS
jgi:regulator of cell morphogenesis and NO signaling